MLRLFLTAFRQPSLFVEDAQRPRKEVDVESDIDPRTVEIADFMTDYVPRIEELNNMLGKPYRKYQGVGADRVEAGRRKRYRRLVDELKSLLAEAEKKRIPKSWLPTLNEETKTALKGKGGWE